ncbi:GxxExxY protein [Algoriphagus sp. NF]|jgi:GxxExxY protein|uniref:GxxExxY protein n=1 Tax=Algoriphagus marincola TaxID=264027 RepID=A0ABS7MZS0_9BACT|nr:MULTISPECIES: GxxExxY protein [Algoriphagus]MBY5949528.1 GxxExxY protein [Algoriphagus marincola]MCR9084533.1 GxxExxY protein [Cyclobacteriaceae bacterium]MDE0558496.1 GxxExxY protein [Algoriphagus sp. NF]
MGDFDITEKIIGEAIYVHRNLGPGLLESTYQNCLYHRLKSIGLKVEKEKPLPVFFDGVFLECGYRLDLVVDDSVVLELKSIKKLKDIHKAQMITYLKLSGYRIGLLINFNVLRLVDGLIRLKN